MRINAEKLHAYLYDQGFDPSLAEDDSELLICCPLCADDRARLYITADSGAWICFHCGEQGGLHRLLMSVCELSADQAFEVGRTVRLKDRDDVRDYFEEPTRPTRPAPTQSGVSLPAAFHPIDKSTPKPFLDYLTGRHVSPELARSRGIGFCITGKYRHRIIVPVRNPEGESLATYVARTILKSCPGCENPLDGCTCERRFPKVLTPSSADGAHPRNTLYNYPYVTGDPIVVVEGAFDALRLPTHAVALLGSSGSPTQLGLLAGLARNHGLVICLDGDQAGYNGARKLAEALVGEMVRPRVAILPYGADPGSMAMQELKSVIDSAKAYRL